MVLTIILLLFLPFAVSAQMISESISTGTAWLLNVRYNHNIWAFTAPPDPEQTEFTVEDYTRTYLRDTFASTLTLQELQIDVLEYAPTIDWIEYALPQTTEFISQKILILNKAGREVSEPLLLLLSNRKTNGGFAGAKKYPSNNRDTAFALQSLRAVDYPDQDIIDSAISFLSSTQNPDGGFGASPSTVYETSLTYLSLVGQTTDATVLGNAINYLSSTQLPDGSWEDDPYSTALALRALASVKPNLSISSTDITFSNPTPAVGDTITITATIKNTGPAPADNVLVQFFDGDPLAGGVPIGETTITSIPSFGTSQAGINYTIPTASSHTIFVKIDPLNIIESLYSKNIANKKEYLDTMNLRGSFGDAVNITYMQVTMFTKFIPT